MKVNDLKLCKENAGKIRSTINTDGWKMIKKFIDDKIALFTTKALSDRKIEDIYYDQAYVQALNDIIFEIQAVIDQGDVAEKISK